MSLGTGGAACLAGASGLKGCSPRWRFGFGWGQPLMALFEVALLNAGGMTCDSHGRKSMVKMQSTSQSPKGTTEIASGSACRPFRDYPLAFRCFPRTDVRGLCLPSLRDSQHSANSKPALRVRVAPLRLCATAFVWAALVCHRLRLCAWLRSCVPVEIVRLQSCATGSACEPATGHSRVLVPLQNPMADESHHSAAMLRIACAPVI